MSQRFLERELKRIAPLYNMENAKQIKSGGRVGNSLPSDLSGNGNSYRETASAKQIGFIPKADGEIELEIIEVKPKPKKPIQASLLEWGKLENWKQGKE